MMTLFWGTVALLLALAVHVVIWRLRPPRYHTRTLLAIFFGSLALVVGLLITDAPRNTGLPLAASPADYVSLFLFVTAWALAYVITYSAIEASSPTLVIISTIAAAGPEGLDEKDLYGMVSDAVLVEPRIDDMVRDGLVRLEDGRYCMTSKGRRFVGLFIGYRWLLRLEKGG
jgi:hypothetical protein